MSSLRAGSAISELRDGVRAAREATVRALAAAGAERARLAFVFATADHAARFDALLAEVRDASGTETIAGASGGGVLTEAREVERGPGVAVLVLAGDGFDAEVGLLPEGAASADLGAALGKIAGAAGARGAAPFLLLFPALGSFEARPFFEAVAKEAGAIPIVGGAPAGRTGRGAAFAGTRAGEGRTGTVLVTGGARLEVAVAQGCRPIGREHAITKASHENVIHRLAGKPAAMALHDALSDAGIDEDAAAGMGIFAGIAIDATKHPLGRGDFLVRSIVGLDPEDGAMAVGERISVGQTVVFQLRDRASAEEDVALVLDDLARRLRDRKPLFGLYFNCMGRGRGLFGKPDHDVTRIRERFPGLPVAGFHGGGEVAPIGGRCFLHAYTGVLAVICEP